MVDQRILRGVSASLTWQNVDSDGTATAPAGTVTVGVTRADGTTLVAAGTATSGSTTAPRTYTLAAGNNTVTDLLTATWTDGGDSSTHTTIIEVVGGYYFSLAEARASDQTLTDQTRYPDALILATRREVEEEFEAICNVAFVPRYTVTTVSGTGSRSIALDRPEIRTVRSVREYTDHDSYSAWTSDEVADLDATDGGRIVSRTGKTFQCGDRNVVVGFEHGYTTPPAEVKRAALQRLRYRLNQSLTAIPDRATAFSAGEGGTYRLDTASATKTGQPDVDAVLARWSRRGPLVA